MTLEERMLKTVPGQVTWANPELGKNCKDCKHCLPHPKPKPQRGDRCDLVRVMTRKIGNSFNGSTAIACSKFEPKE